MPHNKSMRKQLFQFAQQGKQAATLAQRTCISRMPLGIQSAFVADANGVAVMPLAMCTDAFQRSSGVNFTIARNVKMIADVPETSVSDMLHPASLKVQAPPLKGSGAMDNK